MRQNKPGINLNNVRTSGFGGGGINIESDAPISLNNVISESNSGKAITIKQGKRRSLLAIMGNILGGLIATVLGGIILASIFGIGK